MVTMQATARRLARARFAIAGAALLLACTDSPSGPGPGTARLHLSANVSGTLAVVLVVEITAPDIGTPLVFNLQVTSGIASGTITVTAGSQRTITVRALDAAQVETHRGSRVVTILEGDNDPIEFTLLPLVGNQPIIVTISGIVVTVSPGAEVVVVGGSVARLTATVTTTAGAPVVATVQWSTLNPTIATVDTGGVVTGLQSGSATIVATWAGVGGAAFVLVMAPEEVPPALERVGGAFRYPVFATAPPGDVARLFLVLQEGRVVIMKGDTLVPAPFLDLSATVVCCGERGLLGLAFHPQYAINGFFYVNYTGAGGTTHVVRYQASANPDLADPATATTILTQSQPFSNHNGGMLAFGPDGQLYIGLGDGGSGGDPQGNGQNTATWLGKMLRIGVNGAEPYTIPPGNPFVGQEGVLPEIWALGLRNPWRYSFDRAAGDLYIADVGQSAREEVNFQAAASPGGENYGWNTMEGTICFNATSCNTSGLTLPVLDYNRANGCSVTGGYVYRGTEIPMLTGRYFYSDYCQGWVRSFRMVAGVTTEQQQWSALAPGGRVVSWGEDGRGELYILTFDSETGGTLGAVHRIVPLVR